jgi:hypothetical protein
MGATNFRLIHQNQRFFNLHQRRLIIFIKTITKILCLNYYKLGLAITDFIVAAVLQDR